MPTSTGHYLHQSVLGIKSQRVSFFAASPFTNINNGIAANIYIEEKDGAKLNHINEHISQGLSIEINKDLLLRYNVIRNNTMIMSILANNEHTKVRISLPV